MRHPNGYGTIRKLSGKRKRPYGVYITTGFEMAATVPEIGFLKDILTDDLYQQVTEQYEAYKEAQPKKARQVQKCIGYYETRPDAMIALAEYNKNPFDIDKKNITFEQVYDLLYEKTIKDMRIAAKTVYTTAFKKCESVKKMRMREIKLVHLQDIVDRYSAKSRSTQGNIIVLFHAIYTLCMENDICEGEYVFCGNNGKKLTYAQYRSAFYGLFMKHFKIDRTPHECRHTFATIAAASGMNKLLLKKIIGHTSSDITDDVYTHAYIEDLIAEIDKYSL